MKQKRELIQKKQGLSGRQLVILVSLTGCAAGAVIGLLGEAAFDLTGLVPCLAGIGMLVGYLASCVRIMNR